MLKTEQLETKILVGCDTKHKPGWCRNTCNKTEVYYFSLLLDFTTLNLPDPVPVRLKSRRCLDERPNRIVHLDWSKDKQRIVSCTDVRTSLVDFTFPFGKYTAACCILSSDMLILKIFNLLNF